MGTQSTWDELQRQLEEGVVVSSPEIPAEDWDLGGLDASVASLSDSSFSIGSSTDVEKAIRDMKAAAGGNPDSPKSPKTWEDDVSIKDISPRTPKDEKSKEEKSKEEKSKEEKSKEEKSEEVVATKKEVEEKPEDNKDNSDKDSDKDHSKEHSKEESSESSSKHDESSNGKSKKKEEKKKIHDSVASWLGDSTTQKEPPKKEKSKMSFFTSRFTRDEVDKANKDSDKDDSQPKKKTGVLAGLTVRSKKKDKSPSPMKKQKKSKRLSRREKRASS